MRIAQYGNTKIRREYCKYCHRHAFVVKGEILCCERQFRAQTPDTIKIMSETQKRRKSPSKRQRERLKRLQNNSCLYCDNTIGASVFKNGKIIVLQPAYDHLVPLSFSFNNKKTNFVLSCHICNSYKGNKMYSTVEEVRGMLKKKWDKKNIHALACKLCQGCTKDCKKEVNVYYCPNREPKEEE